MIYPKPLNSLRGLLIVSTCEGVRGEQTYLNTEEKAIESPYENPL